MADFAYKFLYGKIFENNLLRSTGDAFQQLVYRLLNTLYPNLVIEKMMGIFVDKAYFIKPMDLKIPQ